MSVNESTDTDPETPTLPAASPSRQLSYAEQNYIDKNQCMKSLVVMCRGLLDEDGKQLLDPTSDPWKFFKPAATVKPLADDYKQEIERRWNHYIKDSPSGSVASAPRPKAWPMNRTLKYLDDNPIPAQDDVAFLKETVLLRRLQAYKTFDYQRAEKEKLEKGWTGKYPFLRLIHCIIDDDEIKRAFLHRNDVDSTRMTVENRNSVARRQKTVWELVSEKWNDPLFAPETEELPNTHHDFFDSEIIDHSLVSEMVAATPEKCSGKFNSMMVELSRVINNWEASGQGEGGVARVDGSVDEDEPIQQKGSLKDRPRAALDRRASFVDDSQTYILYLWSVLDKYDLLGTSLQQLDNDVAAGNGGRGVPSVIHKSGDSVGAASDMHTFMTKQEEMSRMLVESLQQLGDKAITAAQLEVEEREKARMQEREDRERDRDDRKREREDREREREEREKNRIHERVLHLEATIERLKDRRRRLEVEIHQHGQKKGSKVLVDLLTEQLMELKQETKDREEELSKLKPGGLLKSPPGRRRRHNGTPPSARRMN